MGKDLLTATEIMGLKYKTIIFPTISNPIFRDTYIYSDLFPEYKKLEGIERETKVLKRVTSNYYTVEELRKGSEIKNEKILNQVAQNIQNQFQQNIQTQIYKTTKGILPFSVSEEIIENDVIKELKSKFFSRDNVKTIKNNNSYSMLINKIVNKIQLKELEEYTKDDYSLGVSRNLKKGSTKITIWENKREKKI